jgi:MGT family glycosyltransferase
MSSFLIATFPAAGHVNPALPIARALVERGHAVMWYTGRRYRSAIEATGAEYAPIVEASEPDDMSFEDRYPESRTLEGLAALKFGLKHVFLDEVPGQIADLRRILHTFPADVVMGDTAFIGSGMLHELGGPPWATFGISALTLNSRDTAPFGTGLPPATSWLARVRNRLLGALTDRVLFRDVHTHMQHIRGRLGLAPTSTSVLNSTLSPYLYLQSSTEAFEYPRSDLAPQVHFIGPLLPHTPPDFVPPAWWGDLDGDKPVVLVNQGTVATHLDDLLVPSLRALEHEDMLVVAVTGGARVASLGIDVPANARVEPFIPFGALLPHVDAMVTNGGYGGVQFALAHGVPLVVAGTTEEKPEIGARVAWSGAGIDLKTNAPAPSQVLAAVRAVLDMSQYRRHAQRIQTDYARHNAPEEAATLLEQLATTRRPVPRTTQQQLSALPHDVLVDTSI